MGLMEQMERIGRMKGFATELPAHVLDYFRSIKIGFGVTWYNCSNCSAAVRFTNLSFVDANGSLSADRSSSSPMASFLASALSDFCSVKVLYAVAMPSQIAISASGSVSR